jgi:hypothetical protein
VKEKQLPAILALPANIQNQNIGFWTGYLAETCEREAAPGHISPPSQYSKPRILAGRAYILGAKRFFSHSTKKDRRKYTDLPAVPLLNV